MNTSLERCKALLAVGLNLYSTSAYIQDSLFGQAAGYYLQKKYLCPRCISCLKELEEDKDKLIEMREKLKSALSLVESLIKD
jgi:hypothetical protein